MNNKKYDLIETLEALRGQVIYENLDAIEMERASSTARALETSGGILQKLPKLAKFLPKLVSSALKSTIMSIPVVDILAGSAFISGILFRMKNLNDKMAMLLDLDNESFARYILAGSNADYNDLMSRVAQLSESDRQLLREDFESALSNAKELILTIIQAYDTIVAAVPAAGAGAATAGAGAVAVEAGSNITTSVLGFLGSVIPVERFLFELSGAIEEGIAFILEAFFESDPGKLGEIKEKGGPLIYYVLLQYITFDPNKKPGLRLYRFYSMLKREGEVSYLEQGAQAAAETLAPIEQMDYQGVESLGLEPQLVSESFDLKRWHSLAGIN